MWWRNTNACPRRVRSSSEVLSRLSSGFHGDLDAAFPVSYSAARHLTLDGRIPLRVKRSGHLASDREYGPAAHRRAGDVRALRHEDDHRDRSGSFRCTFPDGTSVTTNYYGHSSSDIATFRSTNRQSCIAGGGSPSRPHEITELS